MKMLLKRQLILSIFAGLVQNIGIQHILVPQEKVVAKMKFLWIDCDDDWV